MNKLQKIFLASLFILSANAAVGQHSDSLGSMNVFVTGQYQATIADASKISGNPVVNDSTKKIPVGRYTITSKRIATNYDPDPIPAAQIEGEPLTKLYNGLIKAGFGNYTTPYAEVWYNNLRSKDYLYGLRMKHLSSASTLADYGNSSFSDNEISLYGKKFLKEHTLQGNFDYARNVVHFYGYNPNLFSLDKDATVQRFNLFNASVGLMSHYTNLERYNHEIRLKFYNLADLYHASENNLRADGFVQTAVNKEIIRVNAGVDYYNYKTIEDTANNCIITLNPNVIAKGEKYSVMLGVTAAMDVAVQSKFYFYPNIELSYNIFENIIIPYGGVRGGLHKNSLKSFVDENPFILSHVNMVNTNRRYELFGGLKGTLSSTVAYNAEASYGAISNLAMFVNDRKDILANRFDVIYDDAEILNVKGEVSYQDREKLRIALRGEYYSYKMKTELRAWYLPQLKMTLAANYNLREKIVVKADLFYIDSRYAKTFVADPEVLWGTKVNATELKGVFDINLGLEYRYTKKLGLFLNLNNIANMRYYKYSNYPTQRFNFMAGLSWSF